jgi:hypothetical protein
MTEETKPHMYYWVNDNGGFEWEILLEGVYESYPDGNNIVADLDVAHYSQNKIITDASLVPAEIIAFAEALLDDKDTYLEIQKDYEEIYLEGQK